jgi:hypothetical protein
MYIKGDYWMVCDRCGFDYRRSQMRETWDHLWVCRDCWEPKHPQLTIKAKKDDQRVPVVRPDLSSAVGSTTVGTTAAKDAKTLILTDASSLSDGDSIGVTLDDGTVQWTSLTSSPSGSTVSLSTLLWDAATAGNTVLLSTVADVNFGSDVSASDL